MIQELLFVKRVNNFGGVEEDVYETAHLEILPPRQRGGVQDLSSQDADGLWRITCLNSQRNILLYNNDAYWNRKLKGPFLQSVLNFLYSSLTFGIRATMVTIVKNSKLMIKNGGRKFSTQLIRRPYLKNELFDSSLIIHTILYLKAILFSESGRIFDKSSFEVKEISKG